MELPRKRKIPGLKSSELLEISGGSEPSSIADQVLVVWDHGKSVWVIDVDGNRYNVRSMRLGL